MPPRQVSRAQLPSAATFQANAFLYKNYDETEACLIVRLNQNSVCRQVLTLRYYHYEGDKRGTTRSLWSTRQLDGWKNAMKE